MLKRYFPILDWLPNYKKSYWSGDISAGVTVGIMLIPQGMAYALIAGLPPVYGLYAALVPNLLYAITGSSRKLAVGPVALDSLIVASGLAALKLSNLQDYIAMALFLALFVGLLQLAMGFLKMGFLANFLSRPVVSGFTSAAALVIAISQLKYLLGISIDALGTLAVLKEIFYKIGETNFPDLVVGLASVLLILALKRLHRKLPAAMAVVILSILAVYYLPIQEGNIALVGEIPKGLPRFTMHSMGTGYWSTLFPLALTLAFISFAEAMTMAKAVEERSNKYYTNANQELRALGISNIVGSFFQSYPANSGLSRTAVNVNEGAKTGLASIVSTLVVALTLLFLTPLFSYLPKAVLGAIILVAVYSLIDFKYPVELYKQRKDEFILLAFTFLTTLLIGISQGIIIGVLFSLFLLVNRISKPHIAILGRIKGTNYFKNVERFEKEVETRPEILILRFDAQLFFGNKDYFKRELFRQVTNKGEGLRYVVLNAEAINYIDSSAAKTLEQIINDLRARNIQFLIAGAIGPTRDIFYSSGLIEIIGKQSLFVRTHEAVDYCENPKTKNEIQEKISLQSKTGAM
ncbi:sulfate permease [Flagellimonas allohymeniacidonis]|uniref:Sulfate permease n=2 Tax=Flagellimonas allohymeniacidonis TaxID=2517819 RepID=A0A4V2HSL3_9FLAO|nr:sulfate permease [Allomuricauda hymeniacidonis]